jgi:hypothetical protein
MKSTTTPASGERTPASPLPLSILTTGAFVLRVTLTRHWTRLSGSKCGTKRGDSLGKKYDEPIKIYLRRKRKVEENKKWWESRAVWGGLIALGSAVAGAFGIYVDGATQEEIANYIVVGAGAVGGLVAIYGRLKAEKKIGK